MTATSGSRLVLRTSHSVIGWTAEAAPVKPRARRSDSVTAHPCPTSYDQVSYCMNCSTWRANVRGGQTNLRRTGFEVLVERDDGADHIIGDLVGMEKCRQKCLPFWGRRALLYARPSATSWQVWHESLVLSPRPAHVSCRLW